MMRIVLVTLAAITLVARASAAQPAGNDAHAPAHGNVVTEPEPSAAARSAYDLCWLSTPACSGIALTEITIMGGSAAELLRGVDRGPIETGLGSPLIVELGILTRAPAFGSGAAGGTVGIGFGGGDGGDVHFHGRSRWRQPILSSDLVVDGALGLLAVNRDGPWRYGASGDVGIGYRGIVSLVAGMRAARALGPNAATVWDADIGVRFGAAAAPLSVVAALLAASLIYGALGAAYAVLAGP